MNAADLDMDSDTNGRRSGHRRLGVVLVGPCMSKSAETSALDRGVQAGRSSSLSLLRHVPPPVNDGDLPAFALLYPFKREVFRNKCPGWYQTITLVPFGWESAHFASFPTLLDAFPRRYGHNVQPVIPQRRTSAPFPAQHSRHFNLIARFRVNGASTSKSYPVTVSWITPNFFNLELRPIPNTPLKPTN